MDEPLFKFGISLKLKIFGNFWDIVSKQLQEMYHTVQVIFENNFITKFLRTYCSFNTNTIVHY